MADKLVIDASVAAKWFLNDEQDVDLATAILAEFLAGTLELHAPPNFTIEVCGVITRATGGRQPRISLDDAMQAVSKFFRIGIPTAEPDEQEFVNAVNMAFKYSKTFYDMLYVSLAETLDCQWCTVDKKVSKSSPASFPAGRVLPLSNRKKA